MTAIPEFAMPELHHSNDDLIGLLAAYQLQQAGQKIQKLQLQLFGQEDDWITAVLQKLEQTEPSPIFWRPEVGCLLKAFGAATVDAAFVADLKTQWILTAYLTGLVDDFSLTVDVQTQILLQGKVFGPGCYRIEASHNQLQLYQAQQQLLSLTRQFSSGALRYTQSAEQQLLLSDAPRHTSLGRLNAEFWAYWAPAINTEASQVNDIFAEQIRAALAIADQYVPQYGRWIREILYQVVPVQRPAADMLASASVRYRFGVVEIACPATPCETLEMLIHECSHQYFNLAFCMENMVTDDAPAVYSPLKNKERPLFLLLTGYHAFANVMLMYSALKAQGLAPQIAQRDNKVIYYLKELSAGLEQHRACLTELGLSLYQPLREALLLLPEAELMGMQ